MIDIHTHILPCLDDGAKTKADALELLRMLQEQGVKSVALTPHYYGKNIPWKIFCGSGQGRLRK